MSTTRHKDSVGVVFVLKDQRRRRWSPAEKAALVRRTYKPRAQEPQCRARRNHMQKGLEFAIAQLREVRRLHRLKENRAAIAPGSGGTGESQRGSFAAML